MPGAHPRRHVCAFTQDWSRPQHHGHDHQLDVANAALPRGAQHHQTHGGLGRHLGPQHGSKCRGRRGGGAGWSIPTSLGSSRLDTPRSPPSLRASLPPSPGTLPAAWERGVDLVMRPPSLPLQRAVQRGEATLRSPGMTGLRFGVVGDAGLRCWVVHPRPGSDADASQRLQPGERRVSLVVVSLSETVWDSRCESCKISFASLPLINRR